MRWDKKYPEWYPRPRHHRRCCRCRRRRRRRFIPLRPRSCAPPLPSCYHHSSPLCAPAAPPAPAAAAAAAAEAATPLAIGLEYQGCLHRATGLHHCLRRSANHQPASQPASATRPFPTPFATPSVPSVFVLRLPGADFVENMNIIRCQRIRRSTFVRERTREDK